MDNALKLKIMSDTVKPITDLIQKRIDSRLDIVATLDDQPLDSVPESIRLKRYEEAAKLRAVIQELRDIQTTINALYPNG
jgi:hypothetical protein